MCLSPLFTFLMCCSFTPFHLGYKPSSAMACFMILYVSTPYGCFISKGGFCFCLIEERNKGNSRQRCAHLQSCCYSRRKPALFLSATQASANAGVANRYLKQNKTRTLPWYLPQCFERCIFEFIYLQCLFWSNPFTRRKSSGKNRKMAHWNRNMEWPKLTVVKWWPFKSPGNRIFILKKEAQLSQNLDN